MSPEVDSTILTIEQTLSSEVETKMSIEVDTAKRACLALNVHVVHMSVG